MGYRTNFYVRTTPGNAWRELYSDIADQWDILGRVDRDGHPVDEVKWYDHESDFELLSKKYPDVVFHVIGLGENHDDIWVKHFAGGKFYRDPARIDYPPFDARRLPA